MSDEHAPPQPPEPTVERRRDHLRLVPDLPMPAPVSQPVLGDAAVARPRTIGRLIAQTALIADSAVARRRTDRGPGDERGFAGRILGRFR